VALVHAQPRAVARGDAGGVLPAVLQHRQAVVQRGRDFSGSDDADNAAHGDGSCECLEWKGGFGNAALAAPLRECGYGCERTRPSMLKLDFTRALSWSASPRVTTGPALTRVSVPLSVCTVSVKAPMPAARSRSRSALASLALP